MPPFSNPDADRIAIQIVVLNERRAAVDINADRVAGDRVVVAHDRGLAAVLTGDARAIAGERCVVFHRHAAANDEHATAGVIRDVSPSIVTTLVSDCQSRQKRQSNYRRSCCPERSAAEPPPKNVVTSTPADVELSTEAMPRLPLMLLPMMSTTAPAPTSTP